MIRYGTLSRGIRRGAGLALMVLLSVPFLAEMPHAAGKDATEATRAANASAVAGLDLQARQDFEEASRGFVAPLQDNGRIRNAAGKLTWNLPAHAFLEQEQAPSTVNPSLWRQARLVMKSGLFKVCERIYQVRNADISNMTIIEGDSGLIIADPLVSEENAKAALDLYYQHRPKKPVHTVIYSHSHTDHYGGAGGIVRPEDVASGAVQILAPEGFLEAATAENILAGVAMGRRAQYMYGDKLPASPTGHVSSGLGLKNSSGNAGLIPPSQTIGKSGQRLKLDGLTFTFLLAPNTEAPAEMHWYIEELKALTAAENCSHTMHNLYTLRGAKTRDPMSWSRALDATLASFGQQAEVLYGMHHWPVWGNDRVRAMLADTRDLYRFINDQTLHMANQGMTMLEIAEKLRLPDGLAKTFALRGYYGSLSHNVKAVYNFYLGWFDGNPAHLHPLTPGDAAKKYVAYMGGADAVLEKAQADMAAGNYRWVAEVLNHVVFADPGNMKARELAADALEQLGYQAESGPWRNFYLSGAQELRGEKPYSDPEQSQRTNSQAALLSPDMYFDWLAVRLDGLKASQQADTTVQLILEDKDGKAQQTWLLTLANGVLHAQQVQAAASPADITVSGTQLAIMSVFDGRVALEKALGTDMIRLGSQDQKAKLTALLSLFATFTPNFALSLP